MEVEQRPDASQFGPFVRDDHNGYVDAGLLMSVGYNRGSGPLTFGPCAGSEHLENASRLNDKLVVEVVRGRDDGLLQGVGNTSGSGPIEFGLGVDNVDMENTTRSGSGPLVFGLGADNQSLETDSRLVDHLCVDDKLFADAARGRGAGWFQGVSNNSGSGPTTFGFGVDSEQVENITRMADPIHVVLVEHDVSGLGLACELPSSKLDVLHVAALGEDVRLEGAIPASSPQEQLSQCCMPVECDAFKANGALVSVDLVAFSAPPDLSGEDRLCDVPIAFAEDFKLACGIRFATPSATAKGGNIKRRRGRPRKKTVTLKVSDSVMEIHSILDKEPIDVANIVWNMRLDLGVSGYDDESVMINRLADMEKRDQLAIGRVSGL
ncbi:hypothetical protein SESBI_25139 [Sesbania bispinosa]|nr:hypothetical protein SESBI_25139 [Sesbania bispinosa]